MIRTLIVCGLLSGISVAATEAEKKAEPASGLEVGKRAPDFELKDQLGKPIKLSKLLRRGPIAIVFHRSAEW